MFRSTGDYATPISHQIRDGTLIFTVYLSGIVGSTWAGSLSGRLGRKAILPAALIVMIAGMLLTLSSHLWLIVTGIAALTFGFFGCHSVASAWVSAEARSNKAQASSLYLFAYYLGSSVVGSLGGFFWSLGAWPGVISMTGALLLVALAIAVLLRFGFQRTQSRIA